MRWLPQALILHPLSSRYTMQVPLVFVSSSAAQTVSAMLPHPFLGRWQVNHPLMLSRPVTHFNEQSILDQILPVKVLGVVTTLNRPRCLYPREGKRASTIRKLIHGLFIGDVLLEGNSDSIERPRRSHKFASVASSSCAFMCRCFRGGGQLWAGGPPCSVRSKIRTPGRDG